MTMENGYRGWFIQKLNDGTYHVFNAWCNPGRVFGHYVGGNFEGRFDKLNQVKKFIAEQQRKDPTYSKVEFI